jgi:hypothetical protein
MTKFKLTPGARCFLSLGLVVTNHSFLLSSAIRGGKEITKSYSYLDVCDVLCTVTIRGPIVYLKFKDGRSFYYGTQFAAHIAQQITTRMQVCCLIIHSSNFSVDLTTVYLAGSKRFRKCGYVRSDPIKRS